MPEWITVVKELGLPTAMIGGFLLFLWKGLWPWMTGKIDRHEALFGELSRELIEAIRAVAASLAEVQRSMETNRKEIISEINKIVKGRS